MKKKLISMVDFVLEQSNNDNLTKLHKKHEIENMFTELWSRMFGYAQFFSQKLSERYEVNGVSAHPLNRFVPTDKEGNVIEKPVYFQEYMLEIDPTNWTTEERLFIEQYQEAKDRVLFENTQLFFLTKEAEFYFESPLDRVRFVKKDDKWICSHEAIEDLVKTESGFSVVLTETAQRLINK